jgi:tetratricopeptide (TPR) repeat protein
MPQDPKAMSPGMSVDRNFILSKAQTVNRPACNPPVEPEENGGLLTAYPQMLKGKSLAIRAMNRMEEASAFGAAVIQVDGIPSESNSTCETVSADIQVKVARAIDTACRSVDGLWGLLDSTAFACFFPGRTRTETVNLVDSIKQSLLAEGCRHTVTAGIAVFPTLDFEKVRILDNAEKALEHAKFFGPDSLVCFDAISLNISGDRLYDEDNYQGAIDEFTTALRIDDKNANLHNSLGVCYAVTGEFANAIDHFAAAIALEPGEALAHYNTGLVQQLVGKRDRAMTHFLAAEKCPQPLHEVALQLGKLYFEDGDLDKSMQYLEKAIAIHPRSGPAFSLQGDCLAALGRVDEAVAAYKKALRLNANDAASLSGLGWLYNSMDKNAEIARSFCRHSTEIAPQNGLYRHRLGCLYFKEARYKEAKREFQKARDLGHDASSAYLEKVQTRLLDKAS